MDKTKCVAALFDFDGVVMDTESQYSIFWNEVGKKYHPEYEEFGKSSRGRRCGRFTTVIFREWSMNRLKLQKP